MARQIGAVTDVATWEWTPGNDLVSWSGAVERVTGFQFEGNSSQELVSRYVLEEDRERVGEALAALTQGSAVTFDIRLQESPGAPPIPVRFSGFCDLDDGGGLMRVRGTVERLDGTGLMSDHGRFWYAFEHAPTGMSITSAQPHDSGRILQVNRALADMLGTTVDDLVGRTFKELTDPRDLAASDDIISLGRDDRETVMLRKRYRACDGRIVHALTTVSLVRDEQRRPLYRIAHVQEVGPLLRAQEEIRAGELRYQRLVEATHDGVWANDKEGITTFMNERLAALLGGTPEDFIGRPAADLVVDEDRALGQEQLARRMRGEAGEYTVRLRRLDGEILWASISAVPQEDDAGLPSGTLAMLSDITTRRQTEELRAELAAVIGGSIDAVVTTDLDGVVRTWNDAAETIYGYTCEEAIGQRIDELVAPPGGREEMLAIHDKVAAGTPVSRLGTLRRRKDGRLVQLSLTITPLRGEDGEIFGVARIGRDITEQIEAERRVEASELRFRRIVETANEGVWVVDEEGLTTFANARIEEMLGIRAADLFGRPFYEFLTDPDTAAGPFERRAKRAEQVETTLRREGGDDVEVLVSTSPLTDSDGTYTGALVMVVDMTERRRAEREAAALEAQLHQVQRLETVGQLAGGIAHDFNNLLSVILNYSEFALRALDDHEIKDDIAEIKHAAERAAELTQQLLLFSRPDVGAPDVIDLNALITSMRGLMARAIGEDVALNLQLAPSYVQIRADRSQLEQVLMNLAVNARDAMPDGGRVTIVTDVVIDTDGPSVRLAVSDTGTGMTDEVRERLFEPFFTTKPKGAGTGLGLATVYGIVTGTGGKIAVDSKLGAGTTFRIDFPLVIGGEGQTSDEMSSLEVGCTVLVVEDEPAVRRLTVRILEGAGYRVIAAGDAEEALESAATFPSEINLILTDVVMPGMQGPALAQELERVRPGVPILFMSGYTDRPNRLPAGTRLIEKPFSGDVLIARVQRALEEGARA